MATMKMDCPACHSKNSAEYDTKTTKIPYFGEVMESSILCSVCGFKHSDVMSLEHHDPTRQTLKVDGSKLDSRVIRSQSATVSIPEIGIKVEPGPKSDGYVSNIEGVINRFIDATHKALALFKDDESQNKTNEVLNNLESVLKGELEITLIIEDPFGQSKIMDLDTEEVLLTEDEVKDLKTGYAVIE